MDFGIKDKAALVFGAGGGLGGAIAEKLAGEGVRVALADVNGAAAQDNCDRIVAAGGSAIAVEWDLADRTIIADRAAQIEQSLGPVSILVNNTGGPPPTPAHGVDTAVWTNAFEMMVASVIAITDRFLPGMRAAKFGRVITSTSSGVVAPIPNLAISNALRLALVGWSKTLSREVACDGVTANIVLPGRILTPRIRFLDEAKAKRETRSVEAVQAESVGSIPVGRYGSPEEYGSVVAFLASAAASYVNGSVVRVDGGLIASI